MPEKRQGYSDVARYSGMVFQLFALLVICWFIGQWVDKKLNTSQPYASLLIMLFAIFAYLYSIVRQTAKKE
jgi:hypothetical protein